MYHPAMSPPWITIVSGLPRSGTSMMMRMIEAGGIPPLTDHVRTADEDNPHGYYEFEPVKRTRQDPSWLDAAQGRVVKMVHLLLPELPPGRDYRILMMQRSLDEVLASQARMLARAGKPCAPADTLKRVYTAQLEQVGRWAASQPGARSLTVNYANVLSEPLVEAARIAGFLELPDPQSLAAAVDPSLYRNRAPRA
jgi:hypothetical protein